jgi:formylglycine-generating enzyme required for sulfatase activity
MPAIFSLSVCFLISLATAIPVASAPAESAGKDGAPMALIVEGPFLRGSPEGQGDVDEHPQRTITLSAFYMDRYEVTNRRYQAFLKATGHRVPEHCCNPAYNLWKGAGSPKNCSTIRS